MTGHGCFRHYLHRIGKQGSPECWFDCGGEDTAEHHLISCERWTQQRETFFDLIELPDTGTPTAEGVVRHVLERGDRWRHFRAFCADTLKIKEEHERALKRKAWGRGP